MKTMNRIVPAIAAVFAFSAALIAAEPAFEKIDVSDKFHTEGATAADFNNDGIIDIVAGHYWYEGPRFEKTHAIYEGEDFNPESYSNSFLIFADDFNGDGWTDIVICPHPGVTGYWYENPKGEEKLWEPHEASIELGGETPIWYDIDGDGQNELIFNRVGKYGFAKPNREKPYEPWTFVQISPDEPKFQRYYEGNGAGDINGDGRVDFIEKDGWWEQPETITDTPWAFHPFPFAEAAADMLVYDVDGDGLNDVITSLRCHEYGLAWYKQVRGADGAIDFQKNELIPTEPAEDFFPRVSQLHALFLIDMNGDGLKDFVTGKRYWAHGSHGDADPLAPPVLMWFELSRGADGAKFIPHIIDDASGVGTQVWAGRVNDDDTPDVVVGNKKGVFVFLSK